MLHFTKKGTYSWYEKIFIYIVIILRNVLVNIIILQQIERFIIYLNI